MTKVSDAEYDDFFAAVNEASATATWCALANIDKGVPRVRMVHPPGKAMFYGSQRARAPLRQGNWPRIQLWIYSGR